MHFYDLNLCAALAKVGVNVSLFTSNLTNPTDSSEFQVRHSFRDIFGSAPRWLRALNYISGSISSIITAILENRQICHFHFFSVGPLEAFNVLLAKCLGRYVVITAHDVEAFVGYLDTPGLPGIIYRLADKVIAHNQISRKELQDRLKLDPPKISVIPHGNYPDCLEDPLEQHDAKRMLGLSQCDKVLLFFGQIKTVKGLDILIEAMPSVLATHPEVRLVVAGRPWKIDPKLALERIEALGISGRCTIRLEYIPDSQRAAYYRAADLVILPYRKIYQSGVLLMAMSYNTAVVVSDIPGMTEIVEHGRTGFVFHSESPEDLARVIRESLSHKEVLQSVRAEARLLMITSYDWNAIGRSTAATYQNLVY